MAKKSKLWFSGEDAQLAARFTKFMTKVLYARRASYIRAVARKDGTEKSIEDCSGDVEALSVRLVESVEDSVESKLIWEGIRKYIGELSLDESRVVIALCVDQLTVAETAALLHIDVSTVRRRYDRARDKIRDMMGDN
ncbi:sigma-70 family RNA polymerase sigma factor [Gemmiger sp.]|uniref:sigma-70 family RNA polymerase sigma factor n=1 Tax=Gemmiger sp. TaxID=2049027 RepID=UPI003FD7020E